MSISPDFKASYKKLVLPKFGLTVTVNFELDSINSLYMLIRISGSGPIFPAMTIVFCSVCCAIIAGVKDPTTAITNTIKDIPIVLSLAFSKNFNNRLKKIAKIAEEMAPIKIKLLLFRSEEHTSELQS